MNLYKQIGLGLCFFTLGCNICSCSDFLDEELTTEQNTDYFNTSEGIDALNVSLYYNLRFHFAKEWACATTNAGTDEFRVGGDGSNASWNNYDGNFQSQIVSNSTNMYDVWDGMYIGINNANLLLSKVESDSYMGPNKKTYIGEAYFLRGFNYLKLVSQYGGVPLKLSPSVTPEREFTRATTEGTLAQVISDLTKAYNNLPEKASMIGKMTKDAAAHFLAKAYLLRASEINDSWNSGTKEKDLVESLRLAQEVISHHSLAPNYSDLWNYTEPNGVNELLDEILLSAQFSSEKSSEGASGNQCHLYYISVYKDLPQMSRNFLVEDCSFDQGDDAVVIKAGRNQDAWRLNTPCENIVIRNCRILKGHTLLGIGSEISGGIRNIYMHDCTAPNSVMRLFFVKTNHRRGGFIENIYMKNVASGTAQRVLEIDTEVLYQWKDLVPTYEKRITRIDGIYMDKVTCESADAVYELKGNAELPVKNVRIKDVKVGSVKKFVKKVSNVENVVEKNVTYQMEDNKD